MDDSARRFVDGLHGCFDDLPDPRNEKACQHLLFEMIAIAVLAVICGADSWTDLEVFAKLRLEWLKTFLPMCHLLRDLCLRGNPENDLSVQLVLGFRCVTPDIFHLLPGSAIERRALARKTPFLKSSGDTSGLSFVSREVLRNLLVHCLADSLRRRVFEAISILHREFKRPKDGFVPLNLQLEYFLYMAMLVDDTTPTYGAGGIVCQGAGHIASSYYWCLCLSATLTPSSEATS